MCCGQGGSTQGHPSEVAAHPRWSTPPWLSRVCKLLPAVVLPGRRTAWTPSSEPVSLLPSFQPAVPLAWPPPLLCWPGPVPTDGADGAVLPLPHAGSSISSSNSSSSGTGLAGEPEPGGGGLGGLGQMGLAGPCSLHLGKGGAVRCFCRQSASDVVHWFLTMLGAALPWAPLGESGPFAAAFLLLVLLLLGGGGCVVPFPTPLGCPLPHPCTHCQHSLCWGQAPCHLTSSLLLNWVLPSRGWHPPPPGTPPPILLLAAKVMLQRTHCSCG